MVGVDLSQRDGLADLFFLVVGVGLSAPAECVGLDGSGCSVAPSVVPDNGGCAAADHEHGEVPKGIV